MKTNIAFLLKALSNKKINKIKQSSTKKNVDFSKESATPNQRKENVLFIKTINYYIFQIIY